MSFSTRSLQEDVPNALTRAFAEARARGPVLDLGLPIVSDEVFARYPLGEHVPDGRLDTVLRATRGLVFSLSGLSKMAGLPQMKLGWIAAGGDPLHADAAIARLEIVLDAYLSVGTPVQHALPALLAAGAETRRAISARTRNNLAFVRDAIAAAPSATVLAVEGGWYVTLRVPETMNDEEWAVTLVSEDAVHVHPGFFFDMDRGAHLVISLLSPEAELREGLARIVRRIAAAS
jgi:aspartate/methionine/tyrosine aminotransferase